MTAIIVKRSGAQPLEFDGDLVAEGTTRTEESKRWHTIKVYKAGDKFIAAVEYGSTWQHEPARYDAYDGEYLGSMAPMALKLLAHDPLAHVVGYPRGKQFEDKQKALMIELRRRWDNLVTEVLAQVPGAAQKL